MAVTPGIPGDVLGIDGNTPVTGFVMSGRATEGCNALEGNVEVAVITIGFISGGDL